MRHAPVQSGTKMSLQATETHQRPLPRRSAVRLQALKQRAMAWKNYFRRVVTVALIGALCIQVPMQSFAQVGQTAMSQPVGVANGVVNRGIGALGSLNNAGPGFFYYGINGAGRGLGYFGSYMTLGGFIPYAQDELGGFWSADLRTHLSTNGGFFSNVGVVRKQLTDSGSLLGFGLYWDYDGDMNQYSGTGDSIYGQFGHVYQQVGFSGEYVTDRGAIRSNGYMPVGTTAYTVGAPGDLFYRNQHLCVYGLDAALGGADLEVGLWIPKLEAFGGMISVGGYTFGNSNEWNQGTETGERVVPFFGGVYTRFDITVANNWDINLQYNNDPFFDSTGFARLTYRMGGSRRRNVPDQLEQPLMRNEHIVRGHQTPLVAGNTQTGQPWNFIHVDNTAAPGGDGTAEAPFTNLADAETAAQQEWDVVYVHTGSSRSGPNFYADEFAFQADNQFLVGGGGPLTIEVGSQCGTFDAASGAYLYTIAAQTPGLNPLLSNPGGTSINTNGQGGVTIANIDTQGSADALLVNGNLEGTPQPWGTTANLYNTAISQAGGSSVRNSTFSSDRTAALQRGVTISGTSVATATSGIEFTDTTIDGMTRASMLIESNNATSNVTYDGVINSDLTGSAGVISPLLVIRDNSGTNTFDIATGNPPAGSLLPANILSDDSGEGIIIQANSNTNTIDIGNISLTNTVDQGIYVFDDSSDLNVRSDGGSGIVRNTSGAGILVANPTTGIPNVEYFGTITQDATGGAPGYILHAVDIADAAGTITLTGPGATPFTGTGDGFLIQRVNGTVSVEGASLNISGPTGVRIEGVAGGTAASGIYNFSNVSILNSTAGAGSVSDGILLSDLSGQTTFTNLTLNIADTNAFGISATNAGTVITGGTSTIQTGSATAASIRIYDNGSGGLTTPEFNLISVISDNPLTDPQTAPNYTAISLISANPGFINISSVFTVPDGGGLPTAGTTANVQNPSAVPVSVGGALISP